MMLTSLIRRCSALLFIGLLVLSVGCGPPERATVKGKVTLGETPLPVGNVMFWGADNATATATIDKDGNYVVADAPVGDVKVTVSTPKVNPQQFEMMRSMKNGAAGTTESVDPNDPSRKISIMGSIPENVVAAPEKYADPATSGLTYSVKSGEQTHDIKLAP